MVKKLMTIGALCLVVILTSGLFSTAVYGYDRDCCDNMSEHFLPREVLFDNSSGASVVVEEGIMEFSEPISIEQLLAERADILDTESITALESMLEESQMEYADQLRDSVHEIGSDSIFGIPEVEISDFEFEFLPLNELVDMLELDDFIGYRFPLDQGGIESYDSLVVEPLSIQANLAVWDLLTNSQPPLSFDVPHRFSFALLNMGGSPAHNTAFRIYLDGRFLLSQSLGTVGPWDGGIGSFFITIPSGNPGGLREVRVTVSTSSPQSSIANNVVSGFFLWRPTVPTTQFVDLRMVQLESKNPQPLRAFVRQSFDAVIGNSGNAVASPYVYLIVNGSTLASGPLWPLPAGYVQIVTFSDLMLGHTGFFQFEVRVRERTLEDRNLHLNSIQRTFAFHADGCGFFRFRLIGDTRNIILSVDDHRVMTSLVQDAANDWNGISSNINISRVGANIAQAPGISVTRIETEILGDEIGGIFTPNTFGNYTHGRILFHRDFWDRDLAIFPRDVWRRYLLRHEIGHLLSLHHPNCIHDINVRDGNPYCRYPAVMQIVRDYWPQTAFISDRITNHDIHALINRHGP